MSNRMYDRIDAQHLSMDFKALQSFLTVAEELNFRRAAERLRITQPALSRQISQLEHELGGRLFERTSRRVMLTEAGQRFVGEARSAIVQLQHAADVGRDAMRGRLGVVRVATTAASMFNPLTAEVLHEHRARWPRVNLELLEMPAPEQFVALEENRLDAGFVHVNTEFLEREGRKRWSGIRFDVLSRESLVAAVPATHRLASRASVKLTDLVDEAFLTLPRRYGPDYGGPFQHIEKMRGAPLNIAQEVRDAPAMVHLAGAGFGIALVPQSLTSVHAARVRYLRVTDDNASRLLCVASLEARASPALENFLGLARESRQRINKTGTSARRPSARRG